MSEQASQPTTPSAEHAPIPLRRKVIRQLGRFAGGLLLASVLLCTLGFCSKFQSDSVRNQQLNQIKLVEAIVQQELIALNAQSGEPPPSQGLKALLQLGQEVSQQHKEFQWFGALHSQTLQVLLTQSLEALSRPIGGIDKEGSLQTQQEVQVRLDTLPKLAQLRSHIEQSSNGYLVLFFSLAILLGAVGGGLGFYWLTHQQTSALNRRIHMLSRALHTQQESEHKREGVHTAFEGILKALSQNQQLEHRSTLLQIARQLEELNQSGRAVLDFAKSFHQLSTQGTQAAKVVLNSEQRNLKADSHLDIVQIQLEGLRADIRNAAQGLRKAGEVSRQLLGHLDNSQMELGLAEPENSKQLQQLVEQSQQALKESIEGLVLASQKINMGQHESNKLAKYMAVNQTAWSNLLNQVEQVAESASNESESALYLAKRLMNKAQEGHQAPVIDTGKAAAQLFLKP